MPRTREKEANEHGEHRVFLGADAILPRPASRKSMLSYAIVLGLAFVATGVGTELALHKSDANKATIEHRTALRDAQYSAQQAQIEALAQQLQDQQTREHNAICTALSNAKQPNAVIAKLSFDYGCSIPART